MLKRNSEKTTVRELSVDKVPMLGVDRQVDVGVVSILL